MAPSLMLSGAPTSVAAGDLNSDGKPDLVVTKKGSSSVTVLLGDGSGGFSAGVEYTAGTQPGNVLLADLKGSGKLDVIVTDSANGAINVLFGNGDGTLAKPTSFAGIANPVGVTLGNFKGNGKIDLAVASPTGLAVLFNEGGGRFSAPSSFPIASQPLSLTAADLKGIGHDDLVLANGDGTVSVLVGDGGGHFRSLPALTVASGALSSVVAGDFNHDGKPDLAVTHPESGTLTVMLGRGDGTFAVGSAYAVGSHPVSAIIADLKGDGSRDLITINQAANSFSVLLGNGDGSFRSSVDFTAGNSPLAIAAGNFHADGHTDLAILNYQDRTISVPAGRGDGTFVAARAYRSGLQQKSVATGDLDGDGRPDLVVTNYCGSDRACAGNGNVSVFLANPDGTYREGATYALGLGPVAVALADLKGDKKLDIIALNRKDKTLAVLPGIGDGTFGEPLHYSLAESPRALFVGDFNGDGRPDLAIASDCGLSACTRAGNLNIWTGRGDGSLAESASYPVGYSPASIAAGDFRGTGHLDLVVANTCGNDSSCKGHGTATLLSGDGKGKFVSGGSFDIGSAPSSIALGKLTGNGLDLVVAQRGSNQIAVLHSDGKGSFGAPSTYAVGSAPAAVTIADFNGDGQLDVAVANFNASTVSVLLGTGTASLHSPTTYSVGAGPESLVAVNTGTSAPASLVTGNGGSDAAPPGADFTLLPNGVTASTTTLTANPTTSTVDDTVTLSVTVSGASGTPTGTVDITSNGIPASVCTGLVLDGTGAASCTATALQTSVTTLTASYNADATYAAGTGTAAVTVSAAATTTTLASSATPSGLSQPVTFTATVALSPSGTAVVPISGNVDFKDGVTDITGCTAQPVTFASGTATATCTTSALTKATHSISAIYAGDSNYTTSTSAALSQSVVNATTTTLALTTGTSPDTLGTSLTFTATMNQGGSNATLGGNVTFRDGATAICSAVTVTDHGSGANQFATATCTTTALTAGSHSITATYNGDATDAASTSSPLTQSVLIPSVVAVTTSGSPSGQGDSVTFTATVTPGSGAIQVTGTVAFTDTTTATTLCAAVTVAQTTGGAANATCTTSSLSGGSHTITAAYSGDTNYSTNSGTVPQIVSIPTTTVVSLNSGSLNPSTVDASVTFLATVTPNSASGTMTGTVKFTDTTTATTLCAASTVTFSSGTGKATCQTTALPAGTENIVAIFTDTDGIYLNSPTSALYAEVINKSNSTTQAPTASPATSTVDQSVTFTAVVDPQTGSATVPISGTMSFSADANGIAGCGAEAVTLVAGKYQASCTTSALTAATHSVTAAYSGDTNYIASPSSALLSYIVTQPTTTTTISATPASPSLVDQTVTITATIAPTGNPIVSVPIGGTVQITDKVGSTTSTLCAAASVSLVNGSYSATCTNALLVAGSHSFGAVYAGDTNYKGSTASLYSQTINPAPTSTTVLSSNANPAVNTQITFTATIVPNVSPTPTSVLAFTTSGTVTFTADGGQPALCNHVAVVPGSGNAIATCPTSALGAGTHTIVAVYSGDSNYAGSTSATFIQSVGTTSANLSMTSTDNTTGTSGTDLTGATSTVNDSVTFVETVAGPVASTITPTGKVTFTANSQPIGGCLTAVTLVAVAGSNPPAAKASCTTTALHGGLQAIAAQYGSDVNYGAAANNLSQTVNKAASAAKLSESGTLIVNSPVTFKAVITPGAPAATLAPLGPTGTVAYTDTFTPPGGIAQAPVLINGCTAQTVSFSNSASDYETSCVTSTLLAGSHSITAVYTGDSDYLTSSAAPVPVTITAATATVSVTSSPNPSSFNLPVTFTATISPPAGSPTLTGTVTFNDTFNGSTSTIFGCDQIAPSLLNKATCTTSGLGLGSHVITATYTDPNLSGSGTTPQTIAPAPTTVEVTSSAIPAVVNTPVTFTATVTENGSSPGVAFPTGTVSFTDNGSGITGCLAIPTASQGNGVSQAICSSDPYLTATAVNSPHTIVATYSPSTTNFVTSNGSVSQPVQAASSIVSSLIPSPGTVVISNLQQSPVVENDVIFTATVSPNPSGKIPLAGSVTFAQNGTVLCSNVALLSNLTANCKAPMLVSGTPVITATYGNDPNFSSSSGSTTEAVQDYTITVTANAQTNSVQGTVTITQGFTSVNDPFSAQAITLSTASIENFGGNLTLSCLAVSSLPSGGTAPDCKTVNTGTLLVGASEGLVVDATKATPGTYAFAVTAKDGATTLTRVSNTFTVTVRAVPSAVNIISGASTNNSGNVTFQLPAGVTISGFNCPLVSGTGAATGVELATYSLACAKFTPSPAGASTSTSEQTVTVAVTITTGGTSVASMIDRHTNIFAAGLLGIPIFGLIGLLRGRKSGKSAMFRLLVIATICVSTFQVLGCGGSFKRQTTVQGATPPGQYNILVQGTGSDGKTYQTVLLVNVTL